MDDEIPRKLVPDDTEYKPEMDELRSVIGMSGEVRPSMHYAKDGTPLTLRQWATLFGRPDYQQVASTKLDDDHVWVSTVWLGTDHNFTHAGPPLTFETMVFVRMTDEQKRAQRELWDRMFGGQPRWLDFPYDGGECVRYATLEQALAGHDEMVRSLSFSVDALKGEE